MTSVAFNADGSKLLSSGSQEKKLLEWDVRTGEVIRKLRGDKSGASRIAYTADGSRIIAVGCVLLLALIFTVPGFLLACWCIFFERIGHFIRNNTSFMCLLSGLALYVVPIVPSQRMFLSSQDEVGRVECGDG